MKTFYFSFIGSCKGYKTNEVENNSVGKMLHEVDLCNGSITIYDYLKGFVLVVSSFDETSFYIIKKNSFDCCPFVPVSSFGENLKKALLTI